MGDLVFTRSTSEDLTSSLTTARGQFAGASQNPGSSESLGVPASEAMLAATASALTQGASESVAVMDAMSAFVSKTDTALTNQDNTIARYRPKYG